MVRRQRAAEGLAVTTRSPGGVFGVLVLLRPPSGPQLDGPALTALLGGRPDLRFLRLACAHEESARWSA